MNQFMFGRGWVFDETNGDGGDAGGGAGGEGAPAGEGEDAGGGAPDGGEGGGAGDGAASDKKVEAPKDMKSAIDTALGYAKGPNGEALDPLTGKAKEEKPAAGPAAKPLTDGKETETHHANGKPKKDAAGNALDAEGRIVKEQLAKAKTAAELDLKAEQLKLLKPETQARFREMIGTLKAHEGTIAKQTETISTLSQARDAILGVMEETNTTQDELANYLEFNRMLKSGDAKDLEAALGLIEKQRAVLYQALGREPEGGGLDLLADFPDLAKQVEDSEITRAAALEIAKGRRERSAREQAAQRQQTQQRTQQQTEQQKKEAAEGALAEIDKWVVGLSKSDLDYKAKEDKLLAKVKGVVDKYPPHLWLPTLQMMYDGIEVQKAAAPAGGGNRPLRPSGAKPGAKQPASMQEAIDQGLGYAVAEKG